MLSPRGGTVWPWIRELSARRSLIDSPGSPLPSCAKTRPRPAAVPPERAPEAGRSLREQEVSGNLLESTSKESEDPGFLVPLPGSSGNTRHLFT